MKRILLFTFAAAWAMHMNAQIIRGSDTKQTAVTKSKTNILPEKEKEKQKEKPIIIPTPEFINQPYYYDSSGNKLINLESSSAQLVTKKKTLGLKGSKQSLLMENPSSKIRFITKNSMNFIIKTSGDVIDLTTYIKLYKFTVNNEKREVNINSKEGMLNDKEEQKGKSIAFSVKLISPDNYMIQFAELLEAGEYGFVWVKNMELKECSVYAFGVDWKSSD